MPTTDAGAEIHDTGALLRLLTWLSPSFPVGAFAFSHGLESAVHARQIIDAMAATTDMSHWHFVFAAPEEIQQFHEQLKLQGQLTPDFGTPDVYIIDKERNLRGRSDQADYKEGYNTFHQSELSNEMLDDFKIVLYEYRAALKKNNNASKREI